MRFSLQDRGSLVTRSEIANTLTALAPVNAPITDYQRGYVDALIRVGLVYGVQLIEQPSTLVEVMR
jgi:hypothetical protein